MIKWIPIDIENLPKEEVLAINNARECLVGYLETSKWRDKVFIVCNGEDILLNNPTHYMLTEDLTSILYEQ